MTLTDKTPQRPDAPDSTGSTGSTDTAGSTDSTGTAAPATPAAPAAKGQSAPARGKRSTAWLLTAGILAGLLVLIPVAAGTGAYPVPVGDVLASVQNRLGQLSMPVLGLWYLRRPAAVGV